MKKTQFTDLISTIRKTAVSFITITVFIALGLAFYGGSVWSVDHTEESFLRTYREGRMRTLWVTDPFGLTESEISELKELDGIDDAEGCNIVYRFFENKAGDRQLAAVVQMTENMDRLLHVEGQLPVSAGETAVLRSWAEAQGVGIGDVIGLQEENAADYREFQPVRKTAQWDGQDLKDLMELNVGTEDPGYLTETALTVTAIVDSPVYLSTNPYAHGICSDNGLYIDAAFFVSKEEMPPEAFGGYTSVLLYNEELNRTSSFSEEYKSRSRELAEEVQEVLDGWDRQLVEEFSGSVDLLRAQLDMVYARTGAASSDGENMYELLDRMRTELDGQERFSGVMETDSNNSFLTADNLNGILGSIRTVLGITFLAIGILICYSVVARLVADGAVQIGTRKALGFYRQEILRFYLCYVGAAMLLGGLLGALLGIFGVETAFVNVFAEQFTFTELPLVFHPGDLLPVFLILCGIIFAVTVTAAYRETGKNAITLLKGASADAGNYGFVQNSRVFHRLSMLNQTVLLNLFRDRQRVFGMITGIAGAAALMAAGLTFYFNFTTAFSKQFQEYYRFDYQICYDADSETASGEIRRVLDRYGVKYAEIYTSCFIMDTPDGKTNAPNVIVPVSTEELAELMYFDTETEKAVSYDSGVWMSEYYRYAFDAPAGSRLKLQTLDGREAEPAVSCYYKHHLSTPVVVMDPAAYRDAFGEDAAPNAFYVASEGADMKRLSAELEGTGGYIYTFNFYESFLDSFSSEKTVVSAFAALFILMAVLMGLMTIINLLNVYISEKKDELIILMINGYDRKFAKRYILQDTAFLTLIGILIGLAAGSVLGNRALAAVEGTSIRMIHGVSPVSCAAAAAATAVLTALISWRSLRRVDHFRLSDLGTEK